ncbi:hypothetical protein GQ457_03G014630 [Hibiscus cannabinus]
MGLGTKDDTIELDKKKSEGQESVGPKEVNNSDGHSQQGHNREIDEEVSFEEDSVSEYEEAYLDSTNFGRLSKNQKIKEQRFGSLVEIQDKVLTDSERKNRDKAKKRIKKKNKASEKSELEGISLTDSDMQARRRILINEAKKTLEVGRLIGFEIEGEENEAIMELVEIAERV